MKKNRCVVLGLIGLLMTCMIAGGGTSLSSTNVGIMYRTDQF